MKEVWMVYTTDEYDRVLLYAICDSKKEAERLQFEAETYECPKSAYEDVRIEKIKINKPIE